MDRVFESGAAGSPPSAPASPSSGYPTAGNPQTATPATKPGPYWYHMLTEEIRAVIVAAGLTPDHLNLTQLATAIGNLAASGAAPAGSVIYVAKSTAPTGYLKANGAAVSRTTYAALYAAIGTVFGVGNGSTTFNLPDLRGEFLRGWDDGRGVDSGRVFGSAQADDFKSHDHTINMSSGAVSDRYAFNNSTAGAGESASYSANGRTYNRGGTETRPRNAALLACIKF